MANKTQVATVGEQQAAVVINNQFIDGLTKQLEEKCKYGLSFPKDYNLSNALMGAYLVLKETKDKNNKPILESCSQIMQKQGIGLYFYSSTKGSGKTRMVCSLANELIEKHQKQVKFSTSMKILDEIKSTWGKRYSPDKTEEQLIDELARADILIIDDFGTETEKDWVNEKYYEIIDGRYTSRKITIFTSNYCISRLNYDERITNRILERSLEIPFPEESVREHIAETMKQQMIAGIMGGGK